MADLWYGEYPLQVIMALQGTNNKVPMIDKDQFLGGIELLNLSDMELEEVPAFVKDMPNLKFLDLSNNRITSIGKNPFPPNLRVLNLSDNRLDSFDFADMSDSLGVLEQVYLLNNGLTELPKNLGICKALLELDVSDNKIGFLEYEGDFPENMISLFVSRNKITSVELEDHQLKYLSSINLSGNAMEEMPLSFLRQRRLKTINMTKNPINEWDAIMRSKAKGKQVLY